ncbi:hypothetical protein XELAEV_18020135mg [Xenopus laevis]|uniref:Uncharacterized protein n=1 Tax=Xenopus laevis TaxID=8355 RepID=A0A974D902_XENLA|nr:hypothetical protein XELAEV_18020135mg [Xenopus laevis]
MSDSNTGDIYALRAEEDRTKRLSLMEAAFSESQPESQLSASMSLNFKALEKLLSHETFLCWDIATLEKYIAVSRIPRGLRIKKFPMFAKGDTDFISRWNNILTKCSLELMSLIIHHKENTLVSLREEIKDKQKELSQCDKTQIFIDFYKELKNHLDVLEKTVSECKKRKFVRDKQDYDNDTVYLWRRPKSILKYASKHSRNMSQSSGSDDDISYGVCDVNSFALKDSRRSPVIDFGMETSTPANKKSKNYRPQTQRPPMTEIEKNSVKWRRDTHDTEKQGGEGINPPDQRYILRDVRPKRGKKY